MISIVVSCIRLKIDKLASSHYHSNPPALKKTQWAPGKSISTEWWLVDTMKKKIITTNQVACENLSYIYFNTENLQNIVVIFLYKTFLICYKIFQITN